MPKGAPLSDAEKAKRLEAKAAKFRELAVSRTEKALTAIALIGGLSARANYEYTADQVEKIGAALNAEVAKVGQRFAAALAGNETKTTGGFEL